MLKNEMIITFSALSQNESFARVVAGSFASQLNPTMNELADIKTAVSEAVTNSIIHGYADSFGSVEMYCCIESDLLIIEVKDHGHGIEDIEQAKRPFFTTCGDETRSGMGFAVMEMFMDTLEVESAKEQGTKIRMTKKIKTEQ